jgi:GNAT superfamily N-acetyltransferase
LNDIGLTVTIREAAVVDRLAIIEFNRRLALETENKVLDEAILAAGVTNGLADSDRLRYWLAELGSPPTVIGQAAVTREWSDWRNGWLWWLQSVYIAQPYRGQGVFRSLYRHIREEARARPDVIGLRLYVEDSNQPAHRTYQSLGMVPAGYSVYEELWTERFPPR